MVFLIQHTQYITLWGWLSSPRATLTTSSYSYGWVPPRHLKMSWVQRNRLVNHICHVSLRNGVLHREVVVPWDLHCRPQSPKGSPREFKLNLPPTEPKVVRMKESFACRQQNLKKIHMCECDTYRPQSPDVDRMSQSCACRPQDLKIVHLNKRCACPRPPSTMRG